RMAGRMGNERVTVRNLPIVKIDEERGLILVKGPVPGPKDGVVFLRTSVRVWKRKRALINA
ncbi:MAG: 50S ribosomal protein L3, partial [Planctomycetota bacterium]